MVKNRKKSNSLKVWPSENCILATVPRAEQDLSCESFFQKFQMDGLVLQWAAVLVDEHGSRTEWLFPKVSMSRLSSSVGLGILRWELVGSRLP